MHHQSSPSKHAAARHARAQRLALIFALAASSTIARAQTKSATATQTSAPNAAATHKQEKASETTATRARRVGTTSKPSDAKSATAETKNEAAASATQNATDAKNDAAKNDAAKNEADTKNADATKTAGELKLAAVEKKPEKVEAELQRRRTEIKDAKPEERARLERALVDRLVELNLKDEALSELRLALHEDRYDPAFFYNTGNALARLGDANAAADAYRKAISQRKGNYSRALNNLGVVLIRQGRWDEAFDALNAALTQENFNYAEASYNLGRLHLLRGETNLAIREWTRTLQLDPDHVAATAALARAYAEDGNSKRALAVIENFSARSAQIGGSLPREIAFARNEINSGVESSDAARERRESFASSNVAPSNVAASNVASSNVSAPNVASRTNASRPASQPLRALSVDRTTYDLLQQARDAGDGGKYEEAIKRYRSVLARSGGYLPPANLELGLALLNLHRNDEAIAALTPVATRDSNRYPVAHYHLARLYERQGQLTLSAQEFGRAAELYGDDAPQMYLDLSRVREKLNDAAGALDAMQSYVNSMARQGSVPNDATARLNALRDKAKSATAQKTNATVKP